MQELLKRWIELLAISGSNTKNKVREEMIELLEVDYDNNKDN